MLRRFLGSIFYRSFSWDADRLIEAHGAGALAMARHAVKTAGERSRCGYWIRLLTEVELRLGHRRW